MAARPHDIFDPKADSPLSDDELRGKKQRYDHFNTDVEIDRITRQVFGTGASRAEVLGNTANTFDHLVYEVHVQGQPVLVYRIATGSRPAHYLATEERLYALWRERGIPTPVIFATHMRDHEFSYDWMVMQKVGTESLEYHLHDHPTDDDSYAREAGRFLAAIHRIELPGFGHLSLTPDGRDIVGVQSSWSEAIHVRLEDTIGYLISCDIVGIRLADEIREAFRRNADMLVLKDGVSLHGDYHDANIIIDAGTHTAVAAVDLSQAKVGDPVFDIAFYSTYYAPEKLDHFLAGYRSVTPALPDIQKKIALYALRIHLSKAKLRKRFGYDERIPAAQTGIKHALRVL